MGPTGVAHPGPPLPTILGEGGPEELPVSRDMTAVRPRIGDHEPRPDHRRVPASLPGDHRREAPPSIGRPEEGVDIHELGLDLDKQERPPARVPGHEVDQAAFTEMVERELGEHLPAHSDKSGRNELAGGRVPAAEQAFQVAAAPPGHDIEADLERRGCSVEGAQGRAVDVAAFEERAGRLGDASPRGHVALPLVSPDPDPTQRDADQLIVHAPSLTRGAYCALNAAERLLSPAGYRPGSWWPSSTTSQCASSSEKRRASSALNVA